MDCLNWSLWITFFFTFFVMQTAILRWTVGLLRVKHMRCLSIHVTNFVYAPDQAESELGLDSVSQ